MRPEHRRDFEQFLCLIRASACLHQLQRRYETKKNHTVVTANRKDYEIAYNLVIQIFAQNTAQLLENVSDVARSLYSGIQTKVGTGITFTRNEIERLGYSYQQVREHIEILEKQGFVKKVSGGGYGRQIQYQIASVSIQLTPPDEIKEE
jgi:mevalonate kinase